MRHIGFGDRMMRHVGFSVTELIEILENRLNAYNVETIALKTKIAKHKDGRIQMSSPEKEKEKLKNRRMRLRDITETLIPKTIKIIAKTVQNLPRESIVSLSRGRDQ